MVAERDASTAQGIFYMWTTVSESYGYHDCSWLLWSYSVLPALSLVDGILHCDIVAGSFCTETFTHFIEGLLNNMQPYPAPNSMVVMDNCNIHKHPNIRNLIEARLGALIMYISWTDHHIEECIVNSCCLTLLISTRSSLPSQPWSIIFAGMVTMFEWRCPSCRMNKFILHYSALCVSLLLRIHMVGTRIVATSDIWMFY